MRNSLCILPWVHLSITPGGFVRLCCQAEEDVVSNAIPMSLYTHSIEEIWNSEYMQEVRYKMLEGQDVPACKGCRISEKNGTGSYRTLSNSDWLEEIGSFDALIHSSQEQNYKVVDHPASFHLVTGNLCNLKCRMCNPIFSSQVKKDEVQRQWCSPSESSEPKFLSWNIGSNRIGPDETLGVVAEGFYEPDLVNNHVLRWTSAKASLTCTVPENLKAESLVLRLAGCYPVSHKLKIIVNGQLLYHRKLLVEQLVYKRTLAKKPLEFEFDISEVVSHGSVTIEFESETFSSVTDRRNLGVAIENIEILCASSGKQPVEGRGSLTENTRVLPEKPWYHQKDWIERELFKYPEQLKGLHISGGEPMVQKQVEDILDFCINRDIAKNIYLQFNLNCTALPDRMLEKITRFKKLFLALSIDGYEDWWEYIRFPGKWMTTKENIEKLVEVPHAHVMLVPVLMTYNILNILELFEYADDIGVDCLMYPLSTPWPLDVAVLPAYIRTIAANRFREYADTNCSRLTHDHLLQMADYLESLKEQPSDESLRTFMLFSNDLDASRGQNFTELHSELVTLLAESGFQWTDEKRHAA